VTFTATVRPVPPATGVPTGSVQFSIDGVAAVGGVRSLNGSGIATFSTSQMSGLPSPHVVTAVYSADSVFAASTSAPLNQVIRKGTSTTTVTSSATSPSHTTVNPTIAFTARVTPLATVPGTVQFTINGVPYGGPLGLDSTGRATLIQALPGSAGQGTSYSVVVTYIASDNYDTSASKPLIQRVITP
jgi:hypothetical protein